ncbi:MAG: DUF4215 domain-containing protein, partial [Myxococcales bacterium]|nr:DUF4215 domain-containing protein [Myxococcales bacterium]
NDEVGTESSGTGDTTTDTGTTTTDTEVDPFCGDGMVDAGEDCDDGNQDNNDDCTNECMLPECGDGFTQAGVEECDDGNNTSGDGCDAQCVYECNGTVLTTWNGWTYWKVPVMGAATDTNIFAACEDCGMLPPCQATAGCTYNDNLCAQTNNETSCGNPMLGLAQKLCNTNPPSCAMLWGIYQYMGHNWINDSGCGAESGSWCSIGANFQNKFTLCVTQ